MPGHEDLPAVGAPLLAIAARQRHQAERLETRAADARAYAERLEVEHRRRTAAADRRVRRSEVVG